MKLSKLVVAIFAYATITFCSAYYIATKEVTSAVLVDKAKHSLDLTTNGLHNISVSEAFTIDKSEAAQINFLRCSFARPEFRFSWFCHQQKIDGKMTKNSYVALKDDQQKYFRENVIKSVAYEGRKWAQQAEHLSTLARIQSSHEKVKEKAKASGVDGEAKAVDSLVEGGRELMKAGTQNVVRKNISEIRVEALDPLIFSSNIYEYFLKFLKEIGSTDIIDLHEGFERYESSRSSSINDYELISSRTIANEQSKEYVVDFSSVLSNLGLVAADSQPTKHAGVGKKEHTTNEKIIASISILICLFVIVILIIALVREIKKLEEKLLKDFNEKLEGENPLDEPEHTSGRAAGSFTPSKDTDFKL